MGIGDVERPVTGVSQTTGVSARRRKIEVADFVAACRIEAKYPARPPVRSKTVAAVSRYQQAAVGHRQSLRVPTLIEPRYPQQRACRSEIRHCADRRWAIAWPCAEDSQIVVAKRRRNPASCNSGQRPPASQCRQYKQINTVG